MVRASILLAFLAFLVLTAIAPAPAPLVDGVTGEVVKDMSLEPISPALRAVLEPIYGPVHLISGLPILRLVGWVAWVCLLVFVLRLARRHRRGELPRALPVELLTLTGVGFFAAVLLLPLHWIEVIRIPKSVTRFGLPALIYVVWLFLAMRRRGPGVGRRAVLRRVTGRFIGILGFAVIVVGGIAFGAHHLPGVWETAYRLVPPDDVYVADLQAHTMTRKCAVVGVKGRVEVFRLGGIDITAVTEHNYFEEPGRDTDPTWLDFRKEVERRGIDMLVLPGEEFTTEALHLLLLGIKRDYHRGDYRLKDSGRREPPHYGYDYQRLIRDVQADGGYVIVAHWGSLQQFYRFPWKTLLEWKPDGFEAVNGPERYDTEMVAAWKKAGMILTAGSDFHGWRKGLYAWNLVPKAVVNPEGLPLTELDPVAATRRIMESRDIRIVAAATYDADLPWWLEPPAGAWRYFASLPLGGRISWAVFACLVFWLARVISERRARAG